MNLEDEVTEGLVTFIYSITYNSERKTASFEFRNHPEEYPLKITKRLSFTQVEEYNEFWFEEEDQNYIEQILGISEISEALKTRYIFNLTQGEIIITTAVKPQLKKENLTISVGAIKGTLRSTLRTTND